MNSNWVYNQSSEGGGVKGIHRDLNFVGSEERLSIMGKQIIFDCITDTAWEFSVDH